MELNSNDLELIEQAKQIIDKNYDPNKYYQTVGCALRTKEGKIYVGVNLDATSHGSCAEYIAMGTAITNGERSFDSIVAVIKTAEGHDVIPPCGNCRQMLHTYAKDIIVIVDGNTKATLLEILKFPCD